MAAVRGVLPPKIWLSSLNHAGHRHTMPKSIWRQPNAQHFQVVHRSQRDPLIHDADASQHVLKSFVPSNEQARRGANTNAVAGPSAAPAVGSSSAEAITLSDLERELAAQGVKERDNIGQAALYGIPFDDTEYDYMQHLRPIGGDYHSRRGGTDEKDDVQTIMLEAPQKGKKGKGKAQGNAESGGFALKEAEVNTGLDLPAEVLPSKTELPRSVALQDAYDPTIKGFQPDMDPHLRQVLEALEDDAFNFERTRRSKSAKAVSTAGGADDAGVGEEEEEGEDDEDFDDFLAGVLREGEAEDEEETRSWRDLPPEGDEALWQDAAGKAAYDTDMSLEALVARHKQSMRNAAVAESETTSVAGGPRRRKGAPSIAGSATGSIFSETKKKARPGVKARLAASTYGDGVSAFSMSSSAMTRNKGLTDLDDQFDRMEQIYEDDDDSGGSDFDVSVPDPLSDEEEDAEGAETIPREDFDAILDDFRDKYEVKGGKMKEALGQPDATPAQKLGLFRTGLGEVMIREGLEEDEGDDSIPMPRIVGSNREAWDVQTVLSTKTNTENHPRFISTRESIASATSFRPSLIGGAGGPAGSIIGGSLASSTNGIVPGSVYTASNGEERIPKIRINRRTGFPEVAGYLRAQSTTKEEREAANREAEDRGSAEDDGDSDSGSESDTASDGTQGPRQTTITRPRNEDKASKAARKLAAKEAKQGRRAQKSLMKGAFAEERRRQAKTEAGRLQGGGAADVGRNGIRVRGGAAVVRLD